MDIVSQNMLMGKRIECKVSPPAGGQGPPLLPPNHIYILWEIDERQYICAESICRLPAKLIDVHVAP